MILLLLILTSLCFAQKTVERNEGKLTFQYMNHNEMENLLKEQAKNCKVEMEMFSIGKSVRKREIWTVHLTSHSTPTRPLESKPEVKYIANMHGDEVVGRSLMINLIEFFCQSYPTDSDAKEIMDTINLYIVPTMNPDGYENKRRENDNGVDLNRNFPDIWKSSQKIIEPETQAIIDWTSNHHFILSANFHGGAVVANYPWDSRPPSSWGIHPPDYLTFKYLATTYASNNPEMKTGKGCDDEYFENGITMGYEWYPLSGGMQDWNYLQRNTMELTIELSCIKTPTENTLEGFWNLNKLSLLYYIKQVHTGVSGRIAFENGTAYTRAQIKIEGIEFNITTNKEGYFWKILAPEETYTIIIESEELHLFQSQTFTLTKDSPFKMDVIISNGQESPKGYTALLVTSITIFICIVLVIAIMSYILVRRRKAQKKREPIMLDSEGGDEDFDNRL